MKRVLLLIVILSTFQIFGQADSTQSFLKVKQLKNSIRLNYIMVGMPTDQVSYNLEPKMSLMGLNYNIPLNDWLYTGAGFHAAITGDQGGLFTLGVNLGVNKKIYKNLYFDANIHFGGGGGFRTLVNGGGIIYPNVGLQYKMKDFSFGVQYGQVNFFTGIIKNENVSFFVEIPSILRFGSYQKASEKFALENINGKSFTDKPAVKSVQQVTFDFFFPFGDSRKDSPQNFAPITNTLAIIGYEYQRYLNTNTFVYVHTDAMYSGLVAGFMDLFFGVGKNFVESDRVNLFAKFGVGAAGGRIFPENGLTIYPSAGLDVRVTEKFGLSAHGGYHKAVGGTFEAYTAGISLKYYGLTGGSKNPFSDEKMETVKTQGIQIGVYNQTYYDVAKFGIPDSDLNLIAIKIIYDISKRFYASGEASFAYEGRSGGYAHGIFGLGIRTNRFFKEKISVFSEMGFGVAGGGRIDTGEGVLVRPIVGFNYHINNDFSFNFSGGQMISPYGNVNSTNINIGLTYGLSILNSKK